MNTNFHTAEAIDLKIQHLSGAAATLGKAIEDYGPESNAAHAIAMALREVHGDLQKLIADLA